MAPSRQNAMPRKGQGTLSCHRFVDFTLFAIRIAPLKAWWGMSTWRLAVTVE
jgi:hypothetical protein